MIENARTGNISRGGAGLARWNFNPMRPDCADELSRRRLDALVSPGFLVGLSLLLLNDIALKSLFAGWLTGKLSDFAGLFVFPLFWAALLPRFRRAVYILTALSFVFWKSSYSQPLIDAWNALALLPLGRTVDATDLLATAVLPLSFIYGEQRRRRRESRSRPARYALAALSLFAFTATSYRTEIPYTDQKYDFQETPVELTRKVRHLEHLDPRYRTSCRRVITHPGDIELSIPAGLCFDRVDATVGIGEEQGRTTLVLKKMEHQCPEGQDDKRKLLAVFEKDYVERLRQLSLAPSPSGEAGEVLSPPPGPPPPPPRGKGQLYFVSVGEVPDVNVEELAAHFGRKYGVPIRVLPQLPISAEMRDADLPAARLTAGGMLAAVARKHPKLFLENSGALVIAITENTTIEQGGSQAHRFFLDLEGRFGVVAMEELNPASSCEPENRELLEARLRKVLARAVGTLYFRLPRSDDPRSVLYSNVGCVDELDVQGEDF